jgi:aromatic-L-amino-acid decarboxylase
VAKAARLAGFARGQLRSVPVDERFQVRVDVLRDMIAADRREGLQPLAIVAHAGTTNTGAVDDLGALADLARDEGMWLHADAAYGGFFVLTDRGRQVLRGLSRADSVTLDPHKGLFLPYGTGCLLARRQDDLRRTFPGRGEYMTAEAADEFVDFCDVSPELSRDFRGLRLWLPLKMHGLQPFRDALDEKLDLTIHAVNQLRSMPGIEVVAEPQLSTIAFRMIRPGRTNDDLNRLNRELLERINARGRVMLSATTLGERYVLRICIVSFRTHRDRIDECIASIRAAAERLE